MTIAVIVACKDNFYIVSDTLMRGDDTFTINTKKLFVSPWHKIAMCMAGEASLKPINIREGQEERVLYTDYVLNEFFAYMDSQETFFVENLNGKLTNFMQEHFSEYASAFLNGVDYFYHRSSRH